jgi:hypothetical protein
MAHFIEGELDEFAEKIARRVRVEVAEIVLFDEEALEALSGKIYERIWARLAPELGAVADALAERVWADIEPRLGAIEAGAAAGVADLIKAELKAWLQGLGLWESWF